MDSTESTTVCPMDAIPVQPTSLGGTPPVGDVHTVTSADAPVSNPEVSPPANFKTRQLKITDAPLEGSYPGLRIQGRWLAEAGFSIGGHVRVSVSWQRLLIEVLHPDCVTQRPTTREERQLALKQTLLSRRTDFAAASHLTRSCGEAPQHGDRHTRSEEGASRVEDSAEFPTTPHASQTNEQPLAVPGLTGYQHSSSLHWATSSTRNKKGSGCARNRLGRAHRSASLATPRSSGARVNRVSPSSSRLRGHSIRIPGCYSISCSHRWDFPRADAR
jgi:hypothetical protein